MTDDVKRSKLAEAYGGTVELAFPNKKNSGTPAAIIPPAAVDYQEQNEAVTASFVADQGPAVASVAPVASKLTQIEVANVFDDLSQFKDTAAGAIEAVKRVLTRVPIHRAQGSGPRAGSYVRVHPTFELIGVGIVNDPRTNETYLVRGKQMVALLAKWVVPVDLHVAITREEYDQGHWHVHLWPVPASPHDKSGKINSYLKTHRDIAQHAKTHWLRMVGGNQQYEEEFPLNPERMPVINFGEMPWAFNEVLGKAFAPSTHVIIDPEHSLVSHMLGRE
jgi:hypothetical protein